MSDKKRVLSVGQCVPDTGSLRRFIEGTFGAEFLTSDLPSDTLSKLRGEGPFDLVLINRKLDSDYSDGSVILQSIKADPALAKTPVMIVTNYAEHQEAAVALGAELGFGKAQLSEPTTRERVAKFLS